MGDVIISPPGRVRRRPPRLGCGVMWLSVAWRDAISFLERRVAARLVANSRTASRDDQRIVSVEREHAADQRVTIVGSAFRLLRVVLVRPSHG